MEIFDSHTHLNQEELFKNREELLLNFIKKWWKGLINAWANRIYNNNWIYISEKTKKSHPEIFVKCALWWHPCDVEQIGLNYKETKQELKEGIIKNKEYVVAIGECWIDLHYDPEWKTLELQQQYFESQCELAEELDLPIMIHSRDAFNQTYEILKRHKDITIYIHCRWYWADEIKKMLNTFNTLFIWFCWNITYKNAENLRESIKILPLKNLLIETDAPYLSPQWFRWTLNAPERVQEIGKYIWELLWVSEEQLWEQVKDNFFRLYK